VLGRMFAKLSVLGCVLALAMAGHGQGHDHSGHQPSGPPPRGGPRGRANQVSPQFQQFLEKSKGCVGTELGKTDLSDENQKAVVEMIKPMHDLQREHEQCQGANCKPHLHTYTPPYKCSSNGELVEISPAEVYVTGMNKHIDAMGKPNADKIKKAFTDALPCMEEMFKGQTPAARP